MLGMLYIAHLESKCTILKKCPYGCLCVCVCVRIDNDTGYEDSMCMGDIVLHFFLRGLVRFRIFLRIS